MALLNPAPGRPITSPYGRRKHPITGILGTMHHGMDFGGSFPVLVAEDGVVVANSYSATGLGYYVIIEHSSTLRTAYGHGAHRSPLAVGQRVSRGQVVYQSGTTGMSTGNHLHFEVRVRNAAGGWDRVDPAPFLVEAPTVPGPTPAPEEEEDEMKPFIVFRKEGNPEWSLVAPWLVGGDDLQKGYIITDDLNRAVAWQRMYMRGAGSAHAVDRAGYIAIQAEARVVRDQWLAANPVGSVENVVVNSDNAPVLAAVADLKEAVERPRTLS